MGRSVKSDGRVMRGAIVRVQRGAAEPHRKERCRWRAGTSGHWGVPSPWLMEILKWGQSVAMFPVGSLQPAGSVLECWDRIPAQRLVSAAHEACARVTLLREEGGASGVLCGSLSVSSGSWVTLSFPRAPT